jgi:RNA-directed DNA polymerase
LQPEQYAYRADRSALDAVRQVHKLINTGHRKIVDADLSSYFDPASYCPQTHEVVANSMG